MNILGKTGLEVFPIGFGGIVTMDVSPSQARAEVEMAIEKGVNYFDVAPTYGNAQERLGPALEPFRDNVYLACKTACRTANEARKELEGSLKLLKTNHFDVYQLHAIGIADDDVEKIFSKGGAMEVLIEAKKAGVIRNVGFSAHSIDAALEAMDRYDFDTAMFAVNFCVHFNNGFETAILEEAKKRNMGIIALKSMAKGKWQNESDKAKYPKCWYEPIDNREIAKLALKWTLAQGASLALPPGQNELYHLALNVYDGSMELSKQDIEVLKDYASSLNPVFPM